MQPRSQPLPLCDTKNNNGTNLGRENNAACKETLWKVRPGGNNLEEPSSRRNCDPVSLGRQNLSQLSGAGDASVPACYWLYGNAQSLITTGKEESGEPPPAQLRLQHTHVSTRLRREGKQRLTDG